MMIIAHFPLFLATIVINNEQKLARVGVNGVDNITCSTLYRYTNILHLHFPGSLEKGILPYYISSGLHITW